MNSIDKALLPELPEAPWAERARFVMDMKRPVYGGLHKEAGAPIKSSLVAGGLGALLSGSTAYTAARITGADRRNALQRELDNEVASGNLGIAHNGRRSFADWVGEHPWAVAAIGGALGGAVSGGLRYNKLRKLFNKGVDASIVPKGTVEGLALPVAPAEVAKVSALSSYFEDSARQDFNAEQADAEWDKLAHVVDSMSYDGLAELDVLLESGLVSREDLANLVKEAGWGRKAWGHALNVFGIGRNRYGNRILASEGSELAAQRLSPVINKNLDKANKLTEGITSAEADIARLKDNPAALGRIEELTNKAAKLRKKQIGFAEVAKNDMNLQAIPSGKTAPSATQKANADDLIPKVEIPKVDNSTPIAKADDAPFLDKAKTHFKTNWPWYAVGAGGVYLGNKLMKPAEEPAADGYEVQSSAGAAKLEVRFQLGLISQEEYEKEAGMLGKAVDWGAKKLFGFGVRGGGVVRRAAVAGDDVARAVAGTRTAESLTRAQAGSAQIAKIKAEVARLKGLNSPQAANKIKEQEKLLSKLEGKKGVSRDLDDAEKFHASRQITGDVEDAVSLSSRNDAIRKAYKAADDNAAVATKGRLSQQKALDDINAEIVSSRSQIKGPLSETGLSDEKAKLKKFLSQRKDMPKVPSEDVLKAQHAEARKAAISSPATETLKGSVDRIRSSLPKPAAPAPAPTAPAPTAPAPTAPAPTAPAPPTAAPAGEAASGVENTVAKGKKDIGFWKGFGSTAGAGFQHPIKSVSRVVGQSDHAGFQAFKKKNPWGAAGVTAGRLTAPAVYGAGGLYTAGKVFGAGSDN